ncbi:MAG TPA: hypothetical protein VJP85_00890 [Candidatus Baltobacteraceae bacterium]|nr:hypothetical protein [Candidatus Baltobacteraceae bacterium]
MNTHEHIDELAELHALGVLDDTERASVDAHVRSCGVCAKRVGEAEALIAGTIEEREPPPTLDVRVRNAFTQRSAVAPPRWGALVAAAFVIGLLPGLLFAALYRPAAPFQSDRDRAVAAMVNSHFSHAQFAALAPGAPKAKVLYGRKAPWRFFIAQTTRAYTVGAQTATGVIVLGALHVSGDAAELFVPDTSARSFVLLDGTRAVARVTLP